MWTLYLARRMSDTDEGPPTVSTSQNSTATTAASPTQAQAVQHSTSGPKDIRMQAIIADSDPDETGHRRKKWKNELLTRFRYFVSQALRIMLTLFTFTEENKYGN